MVFDYIPLNITAEPYEIISRLYDQYVKNRIHKVKTKNETKPLVHYTVEISKGFNSIFLHF